MVPSNKRSQKRNVSRKFTNFYQSIVFLYLNATISIDNFITFQSLSSFQNLEIQLHGTHADPLCTMRVILAMQGATLPSIYYEELWKTTSTMTLPMLKI